MNRINFIPQAFVRRRARRRLIARSASLLVVMVAAMIAWKALAPTEHTEALDRYLVTLEQQIATSERAQVDRSNVDTEERATDSLLALHDRLVAPLPTTAVIASLAEAMPSPIGFTSLSLAGPPVEPEGADGSEFDEWQGAERFGLRLTVGGLAPNDITIAQFIGRLDGQPLFEDVELGFSRPVEDGDLVAREFQVTATIPLDREFVIAGEVVTDALERGQVVVLFVLGALVVFFVAVLLLPHHRRIAAKNTLIATREAQLAQLQAVAPVAAPRVAPTVVTPEQLDRALPARPELGQLLERLSRDLDAEAMTVRQLQARATIEGRDFNRIPVTLQGKGSYRSLFGLLERIEAYGRIVRIDRIDVSSSGVDTDEPVLVEIELSTFCRAEGES